MSGKSLVFGPDDRDAQGRIAARSLADMLPPAAAPATPTSRQTRAQIAALVLVGLVVLFGLLFLARPAAPPAPAAAVPPTITPVLYPAAAAPPVPATPMPAGCWVVQTTPTFYAPEGDAAPVVAERGQSCTVVGHHSGYPAWRQIRVGGGAAVWVPAQALAGAEAAGPDLAPPPTATPAPAPLVVEVPIPIPPAPTQCATVRGGGASVQRCGSASIESLQAQAEAAWREQMGVTP